MRTGPIVIVLATCLLILPAGCGDKAPSERPPDGVPLEDRPAALAEGPEAYCLCSGCGKEIGFGETYWCVGVTREVAEPVEGPGSRWEIEVLEAEAARYYCEPCAAKRDLMRMAVYPKGR